MTQPYKIHLDVCCLNRPFDDWAQPRIRLEAEQINFAVQNPLTWMMEADTDLEDQNNDDPS